jgi:hypothetical protein
MMYQRLILMVFNKKDDLWVRIYYKIFISCDICYWCIMIIKSSIKNKLGRILSKN